MDQAFPSNLTPSQWQTIEPLLPKARPGGRPRTTDLQSVVNAIFYLNRTGCQWRYLPKNFPPWQTVYDYYMKWTKSGVWFEIYFTLYFLVRKKEGRRIFPSLALVDSQSAKAHFGENRARDHYKKVIGRKRSVFVDALGFLIGVYVHKANDQDCTGFEILLKSLTSHFQRSLEKILGDQAYRFPFIHWQCEQLGIELQTLNRKELGSNMKPKRWIVERSFAWLNHYRRNSRDYERTCRSSEACLVTTHMQLLLRRLFHDTVLSSASLEDFSDTFQRRSFALFSCLSFHPGSISEGSKSFELPPFYVLKSPRIWKKTPVQLAASA